MRSRSLSTVRRALFPCLQQQRLGFGCSVPVYFCAQIFRDFAQADLPAPAQAGNNEISSNPRVFADEPQDDVRDCGRRGAVGYGVAEAPFQEALQPLGLYDGILARRRPQ